MQPRRQGCKSARRSARRGVVECGDVDEHALRILRIHDPPEATRLLERGTPTILDVDVELSRARRRIRDRELERQAITMLAFGPDAALTSARNVVNDERRRLEALLSYEGTCFAKGDAARAQRGH